MTEDLLRKAPKKSNFNEVFYSQSVLIGAVPCILLQDREKCSLVHDFWFHRASCTDMCTIGLYNQQEVISTTYLTQDTMAKRLS